MVGFGGMFAVYTYISTTLTDVAGLSLALVPLALMVFGLGMVVGNLVGGKIADISVIKSLYAIDDRSGHRARAVRRGRAQSVDGDARVCSSSERRARPLDRRCRLD